MANADALCHEERGEKRIVNQLSRWLTSPPEACFSLSTIAYDLSLPAFTSRVGARSVPPPAEEDEAKKDQCA
ncbi:hypothetical protein DSLASN_45670 [Desulfoluna limicola]|uniref:Uncharacterized protein n=1 Tax=Desulfoluna limicola TaxID=2810562 RepID=A0ABM7PNT4_9BACT|nr:hypothetical protein DSLASN_45670 [Desulfoluna limicola]